MPQVGVVMGSKSDNDYVQETVEVLKQMGVEHEVVVASAHRTPQKVADYASAARGRGIEVLIAAAGGAAALPGALAAWTSLPVIGVPVPSSDLKGGGLTLRHRADAARYSGGVRGRRLVGRAKRGLPRRADPGAQARRHPPRLRGVPGGAQEPMIARYSRPRMKRVWSDESKHDRWLRVELAACEAWTEEGVIPGPDMERLRGAEYDRTRFEEILEETRHELTAFLSSITESIGHEGRWLHLGLTTSDVWDTATSLQLVEAAGLLDEEAANLMGALRERALEHKHTMMMGRTHGIHAEPVTFGLKLAVWWDEMRRNRERLAHAREAVAVGMMSGPVGTHATVPPGVEARVCARLDLRVAPASTQVIQRDRHAQFVTTLALIGASLEKFATEVRGLQRTEIGEVAEPFPKGQAGSSSMPHKRNPELSERVCGLARLIRGHAVTALENGRALGRAGHQPLVQRADHTAGLVSGARLHAGPVRRGDSRPERLPRPHEGEYGVNPRSAVLAARAAGAGGERRRPGGAYSHRPSAVHGELGGWSGLP